MDRYLRAVLYGLLALAIYAGISFTVGGVVNWALAIATAVIIAIAYIFFAPGRER
jgi:hypothetical protein